MKIITWNVNSINSRLDRALELLKRHQPDILCLQELKGEDHKFPTQEFENLGYQSAVFGQKAYNGVAIVSKQKPKEVQCGIDELKSDPQARIISAKFKDFVIYNFYCPNGQAIDSPKYKYKLKWFGAVKKHLEKLNPQRKKMILVGDFNIAPTDLDVHTPETSEGKILCSPKERASLKSIEALGFKDVFRVLHPEAHLFSWWDYRAGCFPRNKGYRIDFIYATSALLKTLTHCEIDIKEREGEKPSDHAPVIATFNLK